MLFFKKATPLHKNKYDYSLVTECNGKFFKTIRNHLSGRGCKYCAVGNCSKKRTMMVRLL